MSGSFRAGMTWVHTWFGLVLGFVLFVVFFFGSLSVFDREIDRWALPETRFEPCVMPSFDQMLAPIFERIEPAEEELVAARERVGKLDATLPLTNWSAYTTHRDPVLDLYAEYAVKSNPEDAHDHVHGHVTIDPRDGRILLQQARKLGSEFFYPLHFSLHLDWLGLGYWIVGFSALTMLIALVSGVVIHRKRFQEFFTFRPSKSTQRSALDLHDLTGMVPLPFHFMFPLTGLIVFAGIYFPLAETTLRPLAEKHEQLEAQAKGLELEPSGVKAPLASVDAMVLEAKRRWAARGMPGEVGFLAVTHVGDANGYVSLYRAGSDRVTLVGQAVHFAAPTGRVIHEEPPPSAVESTLDYLTGLHLQHFRHWLLRWLYVFGGLSGCVCIATGLVFFVGKRKQKHATQGLGGARWADALAVTSVTGSVVATLAILVANRALPSDLAARGAWEERCFWLAWALAFGHAAARTAANRKARLAPAWREQCYAIAALAFGAVLLNWLTTGDHLARTLARRYWPVAGLDLVLLLVAALALCAARKLAHREGVALADEAAELTPAPPEASHG